MVVPSGARLPAQSVAPIDHTHARAQPGSVSLDALASEVYGGVPSTINPDDVGAAGTAATVSRSDHEHEFNCGLPVSLTKTAVNAEGNATVAARRNHEHATNALPWGIVARFSSGAASAALGNGGTEFAINDVAVDATRLYKVHIHARATLSAVSNWAIKFQVDTGGGFVDADWLYYADADDAATENNDDVNAAVLWEPATGTPDVRIAVELRSGAGTLTFSIADEEIRRLWVEDIGPR